MKNTIILLVLSGLHISLFGMHIDDFLFDATKKGNIKEVAWYVNHGANVNVYITGSKIPLKLDKETANKLALFDKPWICNWTPLHVAVANGYLQIARFLLERHACINAKSGPLFSFGAKTYTPMEMATVTNNISMVRLLMEYEPHDDFGALMLLAAKHDHFRLFKFFVDLQDNPLFNVECADHLLIHALEHNKTHMIKYLVEKKIDTSSKRKKQFKEFCSGHTFFNLAAVNNNLFLLEYLLKLGINPDTRILEETALMTAAANGRIDLARVLLAYRADINAGDWRTKYGSFRGTPLHCAVESEYIEMIKFLLQHNADVKTLNGNKKTALYCGRKNPHAVYWLLLYGSEIDDQLIEHAPVHVSHSYSTPFDSSVFDMTRIFTSWRTNKKEFYSYGLFVAAHFDDYDLLKKLCALGADANVINTKGNTPLIVAIKNNNFACAYRLLIDTTIKKDQQGKFPLDYAQTAVMHDMITWYTQNRQKFYHLGLLLAGKHSDEYLIKYCVGHGYLKNMNNPEQIKTYKRKWMRAYDSSKRLKRM